MAGKKRVPKPATGKTAFRISLEADIFNFLNLVYSEHQMITVLDNVWPFSVSE